MPGDGPDHDEKTDLRALEAEARRLTEKGANRITKGAPGEAVLFEAVQQGMMIRRLPDDPLAFRISIGASRVTGSAEKAAYLVFRGDPKVTLRLLRQALAALEQVVETQPRGFG